MARTSRYALPYVTENSRLIGEYQTKGGSKQNKNSDLFSENTNKQPLSVCTLIFELYCDFVQRQNSLTKTENNKTLTLRIKTFTIYRTYETPHLQKNQTQREAGKKTKSQKKVRPLFLKDIFPFSFRPLSKGKSAAPK